MRIPRPVRRRQATIPIRMSKIDLRTGIPKHMDFSHDGTSPLLSTAFSTPRLYMYLQQELLALSEPH